MVDDPLGPVQTAVRRRGRQAGGQLLSRLLAFACHASSLILPRLRSSPSSPSRHAQVQAAECTDHPTRRTPCSYASPCAGYVARGHGHSPATLSLGLYRRFRKDRTVYMMISYVFLSLFCLGRFRFRSETSSSSIANPLIALSAIALDVARPTTLQ